jgi:hypothetical protein
MGDRRPGTADEAAQARATGNFERSEQMASQYNWLKLILVALDMSVALKNWRELIKFLPISPKGILNRDVWK